MARVPWFEPLRSTPEFLLVPPDFESAFNLVLDVVMKRSRTVLAFRLDLPLGHSSGGNPLFPFFICFVELTQVPL